MSKRITSVFCALLLAACAGTDTSGNGDAGPGAGGAGGGIGGEGGGAGGAGGGAGGAGGGGPRNERPELARIGDREVPAESELSIQLMASDPEGAALTFNVRSRLPDGAKFEKASGLFTWTPSADQEGLIALITFEVSDGELKDQETIQITVTAPGEAVNRPPEVDEIGDQVVTAGEPFDLQIQASDRNGDPLSYALRGDEMPGASLGADTGLFTWTPDAGLIGNSYNVEFVVSDGMAETVAAVKFVVREPGNVNPGNLPPVIAEIPDAELTVGERFELQIQVEDEMPDTLTYLIAGSAPEGAALDPNSGLFTWTPVADQADQAIRVVFRVSDGEFTAAERATFQIRPAGGQMMGECDPDPEGDDPLAVMDGSSLMRTICPAGNRDTYLIQAEANDRIQADVRFVHADGDIDVALFAPGQDAPAALSDGVMDNEQLVFLAPEAGEYRLVVYAVSQVETEYSLDVAVGAGEQCVDDAFDAGAGDDERGNATDLLDAAGEELAICGDDADWFSVDLQAGVEATITLSFTHADGDIDATLYKPDNSFATSATTATDDEVIRYTPNANGVHTLRVYGFRVERNTYSIDLEVGEPVDCDDDRVEPNDSHANAEPFRPELYRNLTFCGDEDWYKTEIPDGQMLQVFISYTGNRAPTIEAYTPGLVAVPGQTFEVAEGDGCQAGRDGCRMLTAPGAVGGGFIHYEVRNLEIGGVYDLSVRAVDGAAGCAASCDELSVCDASTGMCVDAFCNPDGTGCPDNYRCYQEWCIQGCQLGECLHPDQTCKKLDGAFWCGLGGPEPLGASCIDFTDCQDSFDCLTGDDVPQGYCTQECAGDGECGAGGACADFGDGQFCAVTCDDINDCRDGYGCNRKPRVGGGFVDVCSPGIEI